MSIFEELRMLLTKILGSVSSKKVSGVLARYRKRAVTIGPLQISLAAFQIVHFNPLIVLGPSKSIWNSGHSLMLSDAASNVTQT